MCHGLVPLNVILIGSLKFFTPEILEQKCIEICIWSVVSRSAALVSRLIFLTLDMETNVMGLNWWFIFWWISVLLMLLTCYTQGDTNNKGAFCGKPKLRGLTWFYLASMSLYLRSVIHRALCWIPDFRQFRDELGDSFAFSSASPDFWQWMAHYLPGL